MEIKITGTEADRALVAARCEEMARWHQLLMSEDEGHPGGRFKGWAKLPQNTEPELIRRIIRTAERIRDKCTLLVVVGIGGSFLGARAVIDALGGSREGWPEVVFAGFNLNGVCLKRLKKRMARESVCMCVISKSGRTVETLLSYAVLKELMFAKYGYQEACRRIFVITDAQKGKLRREVSENQFVSFEVPENVGGRYSVLTPVGLLPVAAAGHDIRKLLDGACHMQRGDWSAGGGLISYGASRIALQERGKCIEIFEFFDGSLWYFGEWLKQLFGESEGKDGKGAYPASLFFSRDLHSIGQFLQQGSQVFYETIIRTGRCGEDLVIPRSAGYPYGGRTMEQINHCAEEGMIRAHRRAGIPVCEIHIGERNEFTMGQLIYFFEMSAALSAYAMGLDPFDQPGVELYKEELQHLLTKQ
ncbi:MAG: glucose-6-phosphate isomerase [Anaerovoracaceae bacterium]